MLRALGTALVIFFAACSSDAPAPSFDVLIVSGTVYDGSLQPGRQTNIGIIGSQIASIDAPANATAQTIIDAEHRLVVPGFVDPHTHAVIDPGDAAGTAHVNHLTQGVTTIVVGNDGGGVDDRETTFVRLGESGIGTNIAFFAGHGQIREAVMGYADRASTTDELQAMRSLLADEMQAGALGLSTGLYYAPGSFSDTTEVIALASTAAELGGIYDTHMRDESSYTVGLIPAVEEAIQVARDAHIDVHISHIKALGPDVWGQSEQVISLIEAARASGLNVTANQYPWEASGTRISNALIPRWVMADSEEKMLQRLGDPAQIPSIREAMQQGLGRRGGPEAILITADSSPHQGMTLGAIAAAMGVDPITAAIDVVIGGDPSIASFVMHQDDIDAFARQPWVMTGSDGGSGHPRFYATYPKVWRDFVVDRPLMSTEQFAYRNSGQVADALGLCDRGYIRPGKIADIAVIDADRFLPNATYQQPTELSTGVDYLLVNGVVVIDGGRVLDKRAGLILRRDTANCTT